MLLLGKSQTGIKLVARLFFPMLQPSVRLRSCLSSSPWVSPPALWRGEKSFCWVAPTSCQSPESFSWNGGQVNIHRGDEMLITCYFYYICFLPFLSQTGNMGKDRGYDMQHGSPAGLGTLWWHGVHSNNLWLWSLFLSFWLKAWMYRRFSRDITWHIGRISICPDTLLFVLFCRCLSKCCCIK